MRQKSGKVHSRDDCRPPWIRHAGVGADDPLDKAAERRGIVTRP